MGCLNLAVADETSSKHTQSRSLLTFEYSPYNMTTSQSPTKYDLNQADNFSTWLDREKNNKRMMTSSSVPIGTPHGNRARGNSKNRNSQMSNYQNVNYDAGFNNRLLTNQPSPKMNGNEARQRLNDTSAKIFEFSIANDVKLDTAQKNKKPATTSLLSNSNNHFLRSRPSKYEIEFNKRIRVENKIPVMVGA